MQKKDKKNLLIMAYALSPLLGSEYRSAWELVNHFAKDFNLTVIFGDSDGLMGSFKNFDAFAEGNNINFKAIKVEPKKWQIFIAKIMLRKPMSLLFPMLLKSWHKYAYRIAKALHDDVPFDIAHQLGPIGFRNPGYLWRLNCHTYWGPIGGAQYVDIRMIKKKMSFYFFEAIFRNIATRLQAHSPYISRAAKKYDRVSFATLENAEYFKKHFDRFGPVISDQGLYDDAVHILRRGEHKRVFTVAWAGSLVPRKNVDGLLDVIRESPKSIRFNIMGSGPLKPQVIAIDNEFPNVNFMGVKNRTELMDIFSESDAILITSLSEANTATLFEAIENDCVPIVPRINGFVSVLNEDVAIFINQGDYKMSVKKTVEALKFLASDTVLDSKLNALKEYKPLLTWGLIAKSHILEYQ